MNSELALCQKEQPWIDSLEIYWKGVEDVDRYGFEHEKYQKMKRLTVEVTCDNRSNRSWLGVSISNFVLLFVDLKGH